MHSFIFCTSFISNLSDSCSSKRWKRWIQFYDARKHLFGAERIILIDDGSPPENIPRNIHVIDADMPLPDKLPDRPVMFRFQRHYGRQSLNVFPGWWRSFTFSSQIANRYSLSKIIHCESDAFVLSTHLASHIKTLSTGWTALWCPRFNFPESAIQVIYSDSLGMLGNFFRYGKTLWFQEVFPERILPFTRIETGFKGDRYGEYRDDYPDDADYACQSSMRMEFEQKLKIPERPR